MTVTNSRPMTYAKMRGLLSFFSALLKGKRTAFRNFLHKLASSQQVCQHPNTQKILHGPGRQRGEQEEGGTTCPGNPDTSQMKPSDFDYLKVIGKGSFGKVLLARHRKDGGHYAVKVLQKQTIVKRKEKHVMVERSVLLKGLQHPFLVGLHFCFQTPNTLYFVLDYVNGGEDAGVVSLSFEVRDPNYKKEQQSRGFGPRAPEMQRVLYGAAELFYHLQKEGSFPEPRAVFYSAEMAMALGYLHSLNIVYRDLKPENILLDREGHVMLTDFGLCKEGVVPGGIMHTFCGTPEYLAPEVLQGYAYSAAVDWWGLGSVLFEMLYGLPPFYSRSRAEMLENILHAPLRLRSRASRVARSLLEGLLERDVSKRLGESRDVAELQEHPFFASIDWDDLLSRKVPPPFIPNVTGPCDISYIDPDFTLQPIPASVNDRCQAGGAGEAFPGFSFMRPVELVS